MRLLPVNSSNIEKIGYDPSQKLLGVQFKNGGIYHYHGIEQHHYDGLMGAHSVGTHLHTYIKPIAKNVVKA